MTVKKQRKNRRKRSVGGFKALISVSALATTLIGWGILGRQAQQTGSSTQPADLRGIVQQILGELPTLFSGSASRSQRTGLRSVNINNQSTSSSNFPVTRTRSSR